MEEIRTNEEMRNSESTEATNENSVGESNGVSGSGIALISAGVGAAIIAGRAVVKKVEAKRGKTLKETLNERSIAKLEKKKEKLESKIAKKTEKKEEPTKEEKSEEEPVKEKPKKK